MIIEHRLWHLLDEKMLYIGWNGSNFIPQSYWCKKTSTKYIPNFGEYHEFSDKIHLPVKGNIFQNKEIITTRF